MYAALAAALFLAGFLYGFWRVGSSWPGVPPAADGIFHLKQVRHHFGIRAPHLQEENGGLNVGAFGVAHVCSLSGSCSIDHFP